MSQSRWVRAIPADGSEEQGDHGVPVVAFRLPQRPGGGAVRFSRKWCGPTIRKLAQAVALEHGKMVSDAVGEVMRSLDLVDFVGKCPTLLKGGYFE